MWMEWPRALPDHQQLPGSFGRKRDVWWRAALDPNLVPSNIEIRRNYFFKPLSWKVGHPTYAGIHWAVKNLLEFKNARNVIVDGNVLENCWTDGQIGYAVLFTVRSEDGKAPWATIENISFTNNIVKNTEQGFQLLGYRFSVSIGSR